MLDLGEITVTFTGESDGYVIEAELDLCACILSKFA